MYNFKNHQSYYENLIKKRTGARLSFLNSFTSFRREVKNKTCITFMKNMHSSKLQKLDRIIVFYKGVS